MQNLETKKAKYFIYEGGVESHDQTVTFSRKADAIKYVKTQIQHANTLSEDWTASVMLSKDCSFVYSEDSEFYRDKCDIQTRELVAKRKFKEAFAAAKRNDTPNDHEVWQLCCSGEQNAVDTAVEKGFKGDPYSWNEFYTVAVGSIESLLSDHIDNDYRRTFFAQFNIRP